MAAEPASVLQGFYWEFFKAFAGPIATVIAAGAVAWVATRLQSLQRELGEGQAAVAQSQRDVARDRLKLDLFEKRYAFVLKTKDAIIAVLSEGQTSSGDDILKLAIELGEAGYFFGREVTSVLAEVSALCVEYCQVTETLRSDPVDESAKDRAEGIRRKLPKLYNEAMSAFRKELSFGHLKQLG